MSLLPSGIFSHLLMEKKALLEVIEFFASLAEGEYVKTWGPYNRSSDPRDKRKIIIVQDKDGKKRTISYPKFLYEQATGIKLKPNESIDHKDCDIDNNSLDNLFVLDRAEHSALDTRRVNKVKFQCVECGMDYERFARHVRDKSRKGSHSGFCGRVCAGKYSRKVQLGLIEKLPPKPLIPSQYYKNKTLAAVVNFFIEKYGFDIEQV